MSFTVWLIGFFFTLGLAYIFQKILARSYCRSWRLLSSAVGSRGHASVNSEMNGRFVLTSRVSPPQGRKVIVRSGSSVFSAALRGFSGWALIYGSGETPMPNPPEEWWLDEALAKETGLDIDAIEAERRTLRI